MTTKVGVAMKRNKSMVREKRSMISEKQIPLLGIEDQHPIPNRKAREFRPQGKTACLSQIMHANIVE